MTPSYTQPTPAVEKPVEFAVGQRQLAAIGFVCFVVLGLVATLAYLAGRVAGPAAATPAKIEAKTAPAPLVAAAAPVKKTAVEQLIMVDAPSQAVKPAGGKPATEPAAATNAPVPVAATVAAAVAPPVSAATAQTPSPVIVKSSSPPQPTAVEKLKGNTYLQVAAIDRGMAEVTHEQLKLKGLPVLIGDSPSEGIFRVLVGPIRNPADIPVHQAALNEAGFQPFIKKY